MSTYSNTIKKIAIPAWYNALEEESLTDTQYYKVTYKFIQAQHDGYCSDYDGESDADVEWITSLQVGYLPKQSWDFDTSKFRLEGSVTCTQNKSIHSGACALWAKVQLESVELITATAK